MGGGESNEAEGWLGAAMVVGADFATPAAADIGVLDALVPVGTLVAALAD
jgi:hypothetical protein